MGCSHGHQNTRYIQVLRYDDVGFYYDTNKKRRAIFIDLELTSRS